MMTEVETKGFHAAMVAMALWRAKNPGKNASDEPEEITAHRQVAMLVLSTLKEGDIDPWMNRKIEMLIRKSTRYIVYLDTDLEIQWWWTERLSSEEGLSIVQANVVRLSCASSFLLSEDTDLDTGLLERSRLWQWIRKQWLAGAQVDPVTRVRVQARNKAREIRTLIAESMAMVLNKVERVECEKVQAMAEQEILIEKDHRCRVYFFWAFASAVGILTGILTLIGSEPTFVRNLAQAAVAGSFGAFISAMTRTRQLALEPQSGRKGMIAESYSRALIGAGAAILVFFAFEAEIVLKAALSTESQIRDMARYFLCMAAGASERILPALIGRAETLLDGSSATKPQKA